MTCQCCAPTVDNQPATRVGSPREETLAGGGGCGPECGCGSESSAAADTAHHLAEIRRQVTTPEPMA